MAQERLQIRLDAVDNTKKAFRGIKSSLGSLKQAVFSLKGAFIGIGAGLVIRSFVKTGQSVEDLQVRLKQLFGSTQEGAKAFDVMSKFASRVPFSLEQIQAASGNLAVVAGDAERLSSILEITGNVAAVTGLDFQQTAEQIQRSFSGGIAAADVFREKGVRDLLGFSAGASISAEETVAAFQKVFGRGGKFGKATNELAGTFTGTLSMLGDKLFNFKKNVAGEGFFDELKKEFKELNKFIEDNSADFEAIGKAISKVLTVAVKGFALAIRGLASAGSALKSAYDFLFGKKGLNQNINNIPDAVANGTEEVKKLNVNLVKTIEPIDKVNQEIEKMSKKLTGVSIITDTIKMGIGGISQGIAKSIVLGEKLNESFRKLAQTILINVIAKLIEKRLLALAELAIEKLKTSELAKQLGIVKAINNEKNTSTKGDIISTGLRIFAGAKGYAEGGSVSAGMPITVGERGRETFIPSTDGQIVPNHAGGTTNVNFTIVANDTRDFDRLLIERRSTITNLINQALNQQGRGSLV